MLYENFYYIVLTRLSACKIESPICMQDKMSSVKSMLHNQINLIRLV